VKGEHILWGRILLAGFFAEVGVFAVVFPVQYFFGQRAFVASIFIGSALLPLVFAIWVCRKVSFRFLLHGALVGVVAALVYLIVAWGQPQPLLYYASHAVKIAGGMAGGAVASRKRLPIAQAE
jgi:hypothetical protein